MTKIGENYDLSGGASITLYYSGGATLLTRYGSVVLGEVQVAALRRAFAAQDAAESEKL